MANPTPIYRVNFNGSNLPGYVQTEDQPINFRNFRNEIINRDGGLLDSAGAALRTISLDFRVLSRLGNSTGLEHLNDCKNQYREAAAIVARVSSKAELKIGDTDRYLMAVPTTISAPLVAGESRRISYSVGFIADPWYYSVAQVTDTFTGSDTVTLIMTDTRRTYPVFSIPSGVTGFVATHSATGKVLTFTRGATTGTVTIDCGTLRVTSGSATPYSVITGSLDFGMYHSGAGTMSIDITGFAGSGTVTVSMRNRYEL